MNIPLDIIVEALSAFDPDVSGIRSDNTYAQLRLGPCACRGQGTLFVASAKAVNGTWIREGAGEGLVSIGVPAVAPDDLLVLPDTVPVADVFNCLQALFDMVNTCQVALMRAAAGGTYQSMIEIVQQHVENPVFFMDSGYRRIAMAPDRDIPGDSAWNHMRAKGFLPYDMFKRLKANRHFDEMNHCKDVSVKRWASFEHTSVTNNIHINNAFAGRVVFLDAFKPHSKRDVLLSEMLRDSLALKMSSDPAFQNIRGGGVLNTMLHELLCGVRMDKALVEDRLRGHKGWEGGFFWVLKVPLGNSDAQTFDYYTSAIGKKVEGISVLFNNTMVAVLRAPEPSAFEAVQKSVAVFLSECDLRGGLSNGFDSLTVLSMYHRQASLALTYTASRKRLCRYESCMLAHALSFCADETIQMLCHPLLPVLKRHDEEKDTRYFETLRAYLENERSLVKTAQAIHVHRNTLVYRLEKMKDLVSVDLDHPEVRLQLLLSYALVRQ